MLVVSMAIENLQANGTEILETTIKSVQTNTSNGNSQTRLAYPVKISIQKTQVKARYPLNYLQDFNNRAKELLISKSVFDCRDGAESNNPTCGWKYDENKERIWDSQGYCCRCKFEDFIGINQDSYERGYACKAFNLGSGSATAFCLVWDDLWYSSYEIMQYSIHYSILLTITSADSTGRYSSKEFILSPSSPSLHTEKVQIKLVGDFSPSSPPPDLGSKVLLTPSKPMSHLRVLVGSPFWMLVDRSQITFDGTECNKIGTSYSAFRSQGNKCEMPVNSCFGSQLDDLHQDDVKRESEGQSPLHLLSRFGDFAMVKDLNQRFIDFEVKGSYSSLISLALNADDLRFIKTVSRGVIDFAEIREFEAASLDGILLAQVSNVGNVVADFVLAFNCSLGVNPVPAVPLSLKVLESRQVSCRIAVEYEKGRNYYCNLTLLNSIGEVCDTKNILFNTSDRHTDQGSQGGTGNRPKGETTIKKANSNLSCDDFCPNWYDFPCFVVKSCWEKFFGFLGIIVGIIVTIIVSRVLMRKYGLCCYKCCSLPKDISNDPPQVSISNSQQFKQPGESCYFNSPTGFETLGLKNPSSLKGKLVTTRNGSYFTSTKGNRFLLTNNQIIKYISPVPEYSNIY
jgi:hypothetical protein